MRSTRRASGTTSLNKAVFLDRDGVINVDHGYVVERERFEWVEGALESIKLFNERGYIVLVVTNQSGIGRGLYSEAQFLEFTQWMCDVAHREGAEIAKVYYCPYHAESSDPQYRTGVENRKPNPGMLLEAIRDYDLDASKCLLIGNSESDIVAAERAGVIGMLFKGGNLLDFCSVAIGNMERGD